MMNYPEYNYVSLVGSHSPDELIHGYTALPKRAKKNISDLNEHYREKS